MSSEEFWEQSPQLYWAYRTFYFKNMKAKYENQRYLCWLQGSMNTIAFSIAINNCFNKEKKEYPKYDEIFEKMEKEEKEEKKKLTPKEEKNRINLKVQDEFNACARF